MKYLNRGEASVTMRRSLIYAILTKLIQAIFVKVLNVPVPPSLDTTTYKELDADEFEIVVQ